MCSNACRNQKRVLDSLNMEFWVAVASLDRVGRAMDHVAGALAAER